MSNKIHIQEATEILLRFASQPHGWREVVGQTECVGEPTVVGPQQQQLWRGIARSKDIQQSYDQASDSLTTMSAKGTVATYHTYSSSRRVCLSSNEYVCWPIRHHLNALNSHVGAQADSRVASRISGHM